MLVPLLFLVVAQAGSSEADELRDDAAPGTLAVTCAPSACKVFVDDKLVGQTPLTGARVAAGKHLMRLEDVVSGLKLNKEIVILSGQTLSIDQKTKPPTTTTEPPKTEPKQEEPKTEPKPEEPKTEPKPEEPKTEPKTEPKPTSTSTTPEADAEEARDVALLQAIEGRLSLAGTPTDGDIETLLRILAHGSAPRARALAAAVLPWLDPTVAAPPLFTATRDADARVRATAGQSLVAIARRLPEEMKKAGLSVALSLLDDQTDEAACAGAELIAALNPPSLQDAFEVRAKGASDVRYACFSRVAGLPLRAVTMPTLPPDPDAKPVDDPTTPPGPVPPTTPEEPQQWLFLAAAAGTGLLAGGSLPGAFVPSRDVLVYDDRTSKLSRQEVSFITTAGAALAGAAVVGGAAWGAEQLLGPLSPAEANSTVGGAGAGTVLGAGLGLMLGADGGGQSLDLALGSLGGFAGASVLAYTVDLTDNDNALMASSMAMGGLAASLTAFTAVPVGLTEILGAQRTDFGLGAGMTGAGAAGLVALGVGVFSEVAPARSAAVAAGGFLGAGVLTGLGFLIVDPDLDVGSRVACGLGLGGQVIGMTLAYVLVPDDWLGIAGGAVVDVNAKEARFGLPQPIVFAPLPGRTDMPIGVSLLRATW